jgi:glycosyltransferase involved in cell wall biosynthesis
MKPLTVIIPARNEADNIGECIASVAWADEVLVVDDRSDDATADLARAAGARVLTHELQSWAAQKNWALEQVANPWVLALDADERVTLELAESIRAVLSTDRPADGYRVTRRAYFLGRWMRFGSWRRDRPLRLFRRELTHYPERTVHEAAEVAGRVGLLRGALLHYSYRTLDDCFVKMRRYAERGALEWQQRGRRPSLARLMAHGPFNFAQDYILRAGFLDGRRGLMLALFDAWQVTMREAKLWEFAHSSTEATSSLDHQPCRR